MRLTLLVAIMLIPTPPLQNSRITIGENLVILRKGVIIMVPSLLVRELWLLVDGPSLGRFQTFKLTTNFQQEINSIL